MREQGKGLAESPADYGRQRRLSGFLAFLLWCFRRFARALKQTEQSEKTLPVVVSNIFLYLNLLELFRYVITLCVFCAAPAHLARRLHVIESNHSNLFARPLHFLVTTGLILYVMVWLQGSRLPSTLSDLLPEKEWKITLVLLAFALVSPLVLPVLALLVNLSILLAAYMTNTRIKDPRAWWPFRFLCDPRTWAKTRSPECFQYLVYAGPYVILMSSIIVCAFLWPLPTLERFFINHPVPYSSPQLNFLAIFLVMWAGVCGLCIQTWVVDRFAAGLPMVMSAPTYAMTRMVNPILYQCIERLQYSLRGTVALMKIGGTPDILLELEFVLLAYQRMRFPFQTNFLELYGISEDLFELLADASERSKTRALVIRVRNLLKGTASCSLSS